MAEKRCLVDECVQSMKSSALGYCSMHYQRLRFKGDLGGPDPLPRPKLSSGEKRPRKDIKLYYDHKMTLDEFNALLVSQGGVCAVCLRQAPDDYYVVDHDHSCCPARTRSCGQCIRGLLCDACNLGIGKLGDDPDVLARAASYLYRGRII